MDSDIMSIYKYLKYQEKKKWTAINAHNDRCGILKAKIPVSDELFARI